MVNDVVNILLNDYDKKSFSIQIPECLNDLKGSDDGFEMVAPQTL